MPGAGEPPPPLQCLRPGALPWPVARPCPGRGLRLVGHGELWLGFPPPLKIPARLRVGRWAWPWERQLAIGCHGDQGASSCLGMPSEKVSGRGRRGKWGSVCLPLPSGRLSLPRPALSLSASLVSPRPQAQPACPPSPARGACTPIPQGLGALSPQALAQPSRYPPPQGVASQLSGGWEAFLTLFYFGKRHCDEGSPLPPPAPGMARPLAAWWLWGPPWECMAAGGARRLPVHQGSLSLALFFS